MKRFSWCNIISPAAFLWRGIRISPASIPAPRNANCSEHGTCTDFAQCGGNSRALARAHRTCPLRKATKWPRIRTVSPCCSRDDDSTHARYRYANATQISRARSRIRDVALSRDRERLGSDSGGRGGGDFSAASLSGISLRSIEYSNSTPIKI